MSCWATFIPQRPQVRLDDARVVALRGRAPLTRPARARGGRSVHDLERGAHVLLDEEHGEAAVDQPATLTSSSSTRRGARPMDGSSSTSTRGAAEAPGRGRASGARRRRARPQVTQRSPSRGKSRDLVAGEDVAARRSSGGRTRARFSSTLSSWKIPLPSGTRTRPRRARSCADDPVERAAASSTPPMTRGRRATSRRRVDERALARAVGPDHADHRARRHLERHVDCARLPPYRAVRPRQPRTASRRAPQVGLAHGGVRPGWRRAAPRRDDTPGR